MNAVRFKNKEITDIILRSFYEVYNDNKRKKINANQRKFAAELIKLKKKWLFYECKTPKG